MSAEKTELSALGHQHGEIIQCHRGDRAAIFRWNGIQQIYETVARYRFSDVLPNGSDNHTNNKLPPHTRILDKRLKKMIR